MDYLLKAIWNLKPTAQFSYDDNDYSTIVWDFIEGAAPTQSQIDAEIVKIKAQEKTDEATKIAAKAELLARLGITEDEAKLLLG